MPWSHAFKIPTPAELREWRKHCQPVPRHRIFQQPPPPPPGDEPAPEMIPYSGEIPSSPLPTTSVSGLRNGAYYLRIFGSNGEAAAGLGVLRIKKDLGPAGVSGDIYANPGQPLGLEPMPGLGLVFPRQDYRCWIEVLEFDDKNALRGAITMRFRLWWMGADGELFLHDHSGPFKAVLKKRDAPFRYPNPEEYFEGDLLTMHDHPIARISIGRFTSWLRSATVEIDCVGDAPPPDPDTAPDWQQIFATAGWNLVVNTDQVGMANPLGPGEGFMPAELHDYMTSQARSPVDHDKQWHYHLLCVPRIAYAHFGVMYDFDFPTVPGDLNGIPREGAAIGARDTYRAPNYDPSRWHEAEDQEYAAVGSAYYRTAVHEIAHAMGLDHNPEGTNFIMTMTLHVAKLQEANWTNELNFRLHLKDRRRLAHWPDPWVRPGGTPGTPANAPFDAHEQDGAVLHLRPRMERTPLGAPVRVELGFQNCSGGDLIAPTHIGIAAGCVEATLTSPLGESRELHFCCHSCDIDSSELEDHATREGSVTLLGDRNGAFFPITGRYELEVRVHWQSEGTHRYVSATTPLFIVSPADEETEYLAQRALGEPELRGQLVLGGDAFAKAQRLLDELLANEQLGPHYRYLEARRLAHRHLERKADPEAAREIARDAILTRSEALAVEGWEPGGEPPEHEAKA